MVETTTCPLCGLEFQPDDRGACQSCPLTRDCTLVCCPNCGYTVTVSSRSRGVGILRRFSGKGTKRSAPSHRPSTPLQSIPLTQVPPGSFVTLYSLQHLPAERKLALQAYGITPGKGLHVHQHRPVTIIQVDHTEIALEAEWARQILVEPCSEERSRG